MPTVSSQELERITRDIFVAHGAPSEDAMWVATLLVRANLRGHDSHGVIRVPGYVAAIERGDVDPRAKISVDADSPVIARLDGGKGFGQVVAKRGITLAIEKAKAMGLGAVTLRRANHVGRLADYAEMAASLGLVGMLWVNVPTALNVAPFGGAARRLGTNPHAVAVPGPNGSVAMSFDMATSVWAEGKLRVKYARGEACPPGIMLNGRGEPSTDPREYYADPVGSLLTAGGHKGSGLSLVVEVLGGILSGAGPARPEKGPVYNGTFILCIDVARFLPPDEFHDSMKNLMSWVRSAPLAAGSREILVPGEPEARTMRERLRDGVPVEDDTWTQIQACATAKGIK